MIGGMGVPDVRIVVEVRVALPEVGLEFTHRRGLQVRSEDVHGQTLGRREQFVLRGHDGAGEVAGDGDDRGASGAEQGVRHLPHDRVEAVREHREQGRVEAVPFRYGAGRRVSVRTGHRDTSIR